MARLIMGALALFLALWAPAQTGMARADVAPLMARLAVPVVAPLDGETAIPLGHGDVSPQGWHLALGGASAAPLSTHRARPLANRAATPIMDATRPPAARLPLAEVMATGTAPGAADLPPDTASDAALSASRRPPGSLFAGTGAGLFAPLPPRARVGNARPRPLAGRSAVAQLLSLIAAAEAGGSGYDAVQHGARVQPPAPPTHLTLREIHEWIAATPGQPHAIGRYQFIPPTLRRVTQLRGLGPDTLFSAEVQDSLALVLLEDAGLRAFEAGTLPRIRFMENLARIWAGLPLPNGRSFYEGYAGNSAAMTWAAFEGGMSRIWPQG
jgi:muramidase (phage lysozyme)